MAEDGEGEEKQEGLGVSRSPNPLFDPKRKEAFQGGGAAHRYGEASPPRAAGDFADALYSGAEFERSKPTGDSRVEVVNRAIPQRCVYVVLRVRVSLQGGGSLFRGEGTGGLYPSRCC